MDAISRLNEALEGRYRIEDTLGDGGMATVYLATDQRHSRTVAVKVLKPELAAVVGAERFLAEIETTANLQHPHILPLYDSGEMDGLLFYVMPHVAGESLREHLDRQGQLPVAEAVRISAAVGAALQHAHERGVVHRDIKPANILLSDGEPVVADFGIALAVGSGGRLTETGLSVGTPYYMSPEQATGDQRVGPASDIYALGAVTYEMLVGEPPYAGSSAQAILARILQSGPVSAREHRSTVPANVDAAIRMALSKLPADRFESVGAFADALRNPGFRIASDADPGRTATRWTRFGPLAVGVAVVALALAAWGWLRPMGPVGHASYELYPTWPAGEDPQLLNRPVLSPDGSWMVRGGSDATGTARLWTKRRDQLEWVPLVGSEGAAYPRVSPDGTRIAFVDPDRAEIRVMPAGGGPSVPVWDGPGALGWIDDESFAVVVGIGRLVRVWPDERGRSEDLWIPESPGIRGQPEALPGGRAILIATCGACPVDTQVGVLDLATGSYRPLWLARHAVATGADRIVLQTAAGDLLAARFDPDAMALVGTPTLVREGVAGSQLVPGFSISRSGALLAIEGPPLQSDLTSILYEAVWVARDGTESIAADMPPFQLAFNFGHALSPDGTRMAIGLASDEGWDVWVKELPDGPLTRLTLASADEARPKWSADGRHIWFQSNRGESGQMKLYRRRADGADEPVGFLTPGRAAHEPEPVPGGEWMVVRVDGVSSIGDSGRDIVAYRTDGDTVAHPLLTSQFDEFSPSVSPDGRWLAYVSTESGRPEVYVRPFPDVTAGRVQVSTGGGIHPLWKGDGTELYYVTTATDGQRSMIAAHLREDPALAVTEREALFLLSDRLLTSTPWEPVVDVMADGSRFLMMRALDTSDEGTRHRLILAEGFGAEVDALLRR